jgi:hypothetical protein
MGKTGMNGTALALDPDYPTSPTLSDSSLRPMRAAALPVVEATLSERDAHSKWNEIITKIEELLGLPPGWDSYGAQPITMRSAIVTLNILASVMQEHTPTPWIVPTPTGSIQFEWHTRGINLEVEVTSEASLDVFYEDTVSGDPPQEITLEYDVAPLKTFITTITNRG